MKTVIFDFDGTIADTHGAIMATIRETFRQMNLPEADAGKMRAVIGLPLRDMFVKAGGITDEQTIDRCVTTYRACFDDNCDGNVCLYHGVADTLATLKAEGATLAIATSRGGDSLRMLLGRLGIGHLFDMLVAVDDVEHAKPAPDMVLKILAATGTTAEEALVVGDTTFDIGMGRAAGCKTCGVTYGNQSREQLLTASPDYVTDDFTTIVEIYRNI